MTHFSILLLFLPAFTANGTPVVIRWFPLLRAWNTPVWEPVLGQNKTWRGWIGGTLIGVCTGLILSLFTPDVPLLKTLYGTVLQGIVSGGFLGTGALIGDMAKSAVKRRLRIPPGKAFAPWDGIDYVVGAMLFALPLYQPDMVDIAVLLIAGPLLSLLANMCSYVLGWKSVWY